MICGTINKSFQHLDILSQLLEKDGVEFTLDPVTRKFVSAGLDKAGLMTYLASAKQAGQFKSALSDLWDNRPIWRKLRVHEERQHMPFDMHRLSLECACNQSTARETVYRAGMGESELYSLLSQRCSSDDRAARRLQLETEFQSMGIQPMDDLNLVLSAELRDPPMGRQVGIWLYDLDRCMTIIRTAVKQVYDAPELAAADFAEWQRSDQRAFVMDVPATTDLPAVSREIDQHVWLVPNAIRIVLGKNEDGRLYFRSAYPVKIS